jgi:hypothetical protein
MWLHVGISLMRLQFVHKKSKSKSKVKVKVKSKAIPLTGFGGL